MINKYEEEKAKARLDLVLLVQKTTRDLRSLYIARCFRVNIVQKDIGKPTAMTVCARGDTIYSLSSKEKKLKGRNYLSIADSLSSIKKYLKHESSILQSIEIYSAVSLAILKFIYFFIIN